MSKTIDPQNPNTYTRYHKGLCDDCIANCCSLPVEVFASDLVRLGLITLEEAEFPMELVERKLARQRLIESFDSKRQSFMLAQVAGKDCVFLDLKSRRCTVYENRPETCRNFPRIGPRPGFCPYQKKN